MAKHIIYLKEGADAALSTVNRLQEFHKDLAKQPPQGQHASTTMFETSQMLSQKGMQFEVWKLRMNSLAQRMQNVINLVSGPETCHRHVIMPSVLTMLQSFNVVTQHDSHVLMNDSKSMKAIASVTMAFLPLATVAVRMPSGLSDVTLSDADPANRRFSALNSSNSTLHRSES